MPVKPIFGSYPYLTIARKYDLDYGDVLMCGEYYKDCHHEKAFKPNNKARAAYERIYATLQPIRNRDFLLDVLNTSINFRNIQAEGWDQS